MRAIFCQLFMLLEKSSNLFVILLVNGLYRLRRIGFYGYDFFDMNRLNIFLTPELSPKATIGIIRIFS